MSAHEPEKPVQLATKVDAPSGLPYTAFFQRAAWVISSAVTAAMVVAFIDNNIWTGGVLPTTLSVVQTNAAILLVGLGTGAFVWAAADPRPIILGAVFASWFTGFGLWLHQTLGTWEGLVWGVFTAAISIFVTVLLSHGGTEFRITKSALRNAIAASFFLTYVACVVVVIFLTPSAGSAPLSPLAQQLVSNFTLLMGGVMVFFFGATSYEKAVEVRSVATNPEAQAAIKAAAED